MIQSSMTLWFKEFIYMFYTICCVMNSIVFYFIFEIFVKSFNWYASQMFSNSLGSLTVIWLFSAICSTGEIVKTISSSLFAFNISSNGIPLKRSKNSFWSFKVNVSSMSTCFTSMDSSMSFWLRSNFEESSNGEATVQATSPVRKSIDFILIMSLISLCVLNGRYNTNRNLFVLVSFIRRTCFQYSVFLKRIFQSSK